MNPSQLLWLLTIPALALGLAWSLVDRLLWKRIVSVACRAIGLALLVIGLCGPFAPLEGHGRHTIFILDVSESIDLEAAQRALSRVSEFQQGLDSNDSASLYLVGSHTRPGEAKAVAEEIQNWADGMETEFRQSSRLAAALLETRMDFPAEKAARVCLLSDGQETEGDLAAAIDTLAKEGIEVTFLPVSGLSHPEVALVGLDSLTKHAYQGETLRLEATLAANSARSGRARLVHRGVVMQTKEFHLEQAGELTIPFDILATTPGPSPWTVEIVPDQDYFFLNNKIEQTIDVLGKSRLLILHRKPRLMSSWARALRSQDFEVEIRTEHGFPETLAQLLAFDAIILADIPATQLSLPQMENLKLFVSEFGGGVAMFGSENSFGLGGYYKTPVEDVLPLVSRFEKDKEKPSLAMVLVIDKSGSMEGLPIQLARDAAKATVEVLGARDQISVVAFDGSPRTIVAMTSASQKHGVQSQIDTLEAGGGTDMYPAMRLARDHLLQTVTKIKHMILLSDGQSQPADFEGLCRDLASQGITVSSVALGDGADRELLNRLASIGQGRYYETTDPHDVPQIFTKETMKVGRSAIKEDLFAPLVISDHPILAGYDTEPLPYLLGYCVAKAKPTAEVLLSLETGDPLLAIRRFGLGMGLAYTSDVTPIWGSEWIAWPQCGRFWGQVLRPLVRRRNAQGLSVEESIGPRTWQLQLAARDEHGNPVSQIDWSVQAIDESGQSEPVAIREVGLGRYALETDLEGKERVVLSLHDRTRDRLMTLYYSRPYPREYSLQSQLPPSLAERAATWETLDSAPMSPAQIRQPLTIPVYLLALLFFLAGIFFRRV